MTSWTSILICICFKEIYSWNSALDNIKVLSSLTFPCISLSEQFIPIRNQVISHSLEKSKSRNLLSNKNEQLSDITITEIIPRYSNSTDFSIIKDKSIIKVNSSNSSITKPKSTTTIPYTKFPFTFKGTVIESSYKSNTKINIQESTLSTEVPINFTASKKPLTNKTGTPISVDSFTTVNDITENTLYPVHYIFIFCGIILALLLLAYAIYHFYYKEQVRRLRLQLMPVYNFNPTESDDWENNLLEEFTSLRTKDKNSSVVTGSRTTTQNTFSTPLCQQSEIPVSHL